MRLTKYLARTASVALLSASLFSAPLTSWAADPADYAISGGWFYTQTSNAPGISGYAVTDTATARFYSEFQRLGGVDVVGYPISNRFSWDGFETQAFQRLILQWHPDTGSVQFVNVFDRMHEAGQDTWLFEEKQVPRQASYNDLGKEFSQVVAERLALLDDNPAIKQVYFSAPADPVAFNGLPTAPIQDLGNVIVLRAQRVVLQQWKVNTPWAKAGDVTIANGGQVALEAGLLPADALKPTPAAQTTNVTVPSTQPPAAPAMVQQPPVTPNQPTTQVVDPAPATGSNTSPALTAPSSPIEGPLMVSAEVVTPIVSGGTGMLSIRVTDKNGTPSPSLITAIVRYPLAPDESAYTQDQVLFTVLGNNGTGTLNVPIPTVIPSGTHVEIEVSAVMPPHSGSYVFSAVVN